MNSRFVTKCQFETKRVSLAVVTATRPQRLDAPSRKVRLHRNPAKLNRQCAAQLLPRSRLPLHGPLRAVRLRLLSKRNASQLPRRVARLQLRNRNPSHNQRNQLPRTSPKRSRWYGAWLCSRT